MAQRKARNRTVLVLAVLAVVNLYVFLVSDRPAAGLKLPVAAVAAGRQSGFAATPPSACGPNSVRIFDGLERLLRLETRLADQRTFRLGLLELGVLAEEVALAEAAVRDTVALGLLSGSGASLRVALDRFGGLHAFEVELAEGHVVQGCRDAPQRLVVRNLQHPLRTDVEVIAFKLPRNGDLATAIEQADEHPDLAAVVAEPLAQDVDFMVEARPGDAVQVIVEKRYLGREFHRYGTVIAVRYRGAAGKVAYYRHKPRGMASGYFTRDGEASTRLLLRSPVAAYPADPTAQATRVPTIEIVEGRLGAVYRREEGAPVVAVADGVVRAVGPHGEFGEMIEIALDDGRVVRYAHLMRTLGELEPGQRVLQGTRIGLVGHSGRVRTNQLRFEVFRPGANGDEHLDPLLLTQRGEEVSPRRGPSLTGERLDVFRDEVKPWRRAMRQAAR
ncbi:MAG: M23 family metallopeptidase [Myxococcales bacterium FL481]|nr:MAG: M23 family metallopeptidase [Myxococcales bacterium FL481]